MSRRGVWLVQNEYIIAGLEYDEDAVFIHHDVVKWGKQALRYMDKAVEEACEKIKQEGFTELWSYFKPQEDHLFKFCDRYGFEVVKVSEDEILVMKELSCPY